MILKSFKYSTHFWSLDHLSLNQCNLIVGKNASGKSRTLDALQLVKSWIGLHNYVSADEDFETQLVFEDDNDRIELHLTIGGDQIIAERLIVNGRDLIVRTLDEAYIDSVKANPPTGMLLMHVNRDTSKYPIFEKIISWARTTITQSFIRRDTDTNEELYDIVATFTPEMKSRVVRMMNRVGFPLVEIDTFSNIFFPQKEAHKTGMSDFDRFKILSVIEQDIESSMWLSDLSNGMYRTLSLFIRLEQMTSLHHPALIAIDDLGEGLDYSRASEVGKLLFEICRENGIQVIATSNEEFMMNIVNISDWNILVREGPTVRSVNARQYPDEFRKFKYSGLDNFDFFTSDFLNRISGNLFDRE